MKPTAHTSPGHWQHLDDPSQAPRYEAIARMIAPTDSVLDYGCGSAVLAGYLPKGAAYDGYEPNADAAAQAMVRKPGYIFMQKPEAIGYTVIVFADCCYYGDPVAMLDYGARHLAPGGRLIVTIYQRPQRWPNWLYALRGRMTNLRATAIVCAHIKRKGWTLLTDGVVPRPGGGEWRLLCVQP